MDKPEAKGQALLEEPGPGSGPFPGFSGKGVRIAVIDSGVHPAHPHILADLLVGSVAVSRNGTIDTAAEAAIDRLGHGTAVTAAIQEKAPDAEYLTVRVFQDALKTTAAALVAAIDWCLDRQVDLINLSLGSVNSAHRDAFAAAADRSAAAGAVLVAAREADGVACYPGALPTALGVALDWECPRESYRVATESAGPVLCASGYPRPIPGVPSRRNLFGISFAVANMTGLSARACEHLRGGGDRVNRQGLLRLLLEQQDVPSAE